jgi:hypothetical protein
MRKGLALFGALFLFLIFAPTVFGLAIWPFGGGGGLFGTLAAFGLSFLIPAAEVVFGIAILVMLLAAVIEARGSYHLKEHVKDMLPWAIVIFALVFIHNQLAS